ncbi:MAG: RagB/SusD family nutrient uptake outer membrane protein [Ignavibacteria bacterium]
MKKSTFFLIIVIMIFSNSCHDELLQEPITEKVTTNFYSTEIEIEEAIIGVYAALQEDGLYNAYLTVLGEIPSDNTFDEVPANDDGNYGQLDEFTVISSNAIISGTWQDSYVAIQRANVVLNRIEDVGFEDETVKNSRKGEMRFIRALLYFNLVRIYGDVPLVVEEAEDVNDYFGQGRTSEDEVYTQIKEDLTEAIELLPLTVSEQGRVTRGAAQALLGKVLLTLQNFSQAEVYLQNVVSSGSYSLVSKPDLVFGVENENNQEIIFAVQFASGVNGNSEGSDAFRLFSPSGTVSSAKGHNLPTKSLYALYTDEDLRKETYLGVTSEGIPYSKKLSEPSTTSSDGGSDCIVLRYADVLLMLAEVKNELGNTSEAASYLNMIRERAGLSAVEVSSQSDLRDAIELERRLELIGEGHHWFDLLRTDKAIEVMNSWFNSENKNITIDDHNLLMPIPQDQIDTDPAIQQNPGY